MYFSSRNLRNPSLLTKMLCIYGNAFWRNMSIYTLCLNNEKKKSKDFFFEVYLLRFFCMAREIPNKHHIHFLFKYEDSTDSLINTLLDT